MMVFLTYLARNKRQNLQKYAINRNSVINFVIISKLMQSKYESPKITVAIRKRPLNKKQISRNQTDIIRIEDQGSIVVSQLKQKVDLTKYIEETTFNFDFAFDQASDNQNIYDACIRPLIDSAFMGAKVSCFAYGQTGSGKTYTMKGDMEKDVPGLYYLGAKQIFQYIQHPNFSHLKVCVSFFEIYCGKLYDLLNNRNELKIMEDKKNNINVIGMEEKHIYSAKEFLDLIQYGSNFRVTSQNATNADSSRSHAILQIIIKEGKKTFTKISFIDLAGNERGADHMDQSKQTKIDGAQINKSLLALKQCIRALDQGKGHTPFRGSKLTMVLKDSFVGFCKTVMIGNVSPNVTSAQNTMNTLRYADRVKQLKNSGEGGQLSRQEQVARQMMLPRATNKNSIKVNINKDDDEEQIQAKKEMARKIMKKNGQKCETTNDMEAEEPPAPRRRTDMFPIQKDINLSKNQAQRKSSNHTPGKIFIQPQDQNNPRQKHFNYQNFQNNKEVKHIDMKPQSRSMVTQIQSQNQFARNKPYGIPRTENTHQQLNSSKLQYQYHNLMQDIDNMKQQFFTDHIQMVREESFIIKQEGEQCDKAVRSPHIDLGMYMDSVQRKINRKIEMFLELKKKADYLSSKINQSYQMGKILGQSNSFDEQLLEGLPVDDFGGKLF